MIKKHKRTNRKQRKGDKNDAPDMMSNWGLNFSIWGMMTSCSACLNPAAPLNSPKGLALDLPSAPPPPPPSASPSALPLVVSTPSSMMSLLLHRVGDEVDCSDWSRERSRSILLASSDSTPSILSMSSSTPSPSFFSPLILIISCFTGFWVLAVAVAVVAAGVRPK